jgi:hypothetical protein
MVVLQVIKFLNHDRLAYIFFNGKPELHSRLIFWIYLW